MGTWNGDNNPQARHNQKLREVTTLCDTVASLGVALRERVAKADAVFDHVSRITVAEDPTAAAVETYARECLEAAQDSKNASTTALTKAVAQAAALKAQRDGIEKAGVMAANALVAAVRESESDIITSLQAVHDAAAEQLDNAGQQVPYTVTTAGDALVNDCGQAWLDARNAVATMNTCHNVRASFARLGIKVSNDPSDDRGQLKDGTDAHAKAWQLDDEVAQKLAVARAGGEFWLPTVAQHEEHVREVVAQRAKAKAAAQADTTEEKRLAAAKRDVARAQAERAATHQRMQQHQPEGVKVLQPGGEWISK